MTDFHALARAALAARVSDIDDDSPTVAALYVLEPLLTYSDLWQDARRQLRERWTTSRVRDGWRAALLEGPPDDAFWIHSFDRMCGRGIGLVDAERSWKSKPPDRMFRPHHYVASGVDGAAALHVTLLSDLDPVAAVDFVATRSSEYLIWSGVEMLDLGKSEELVNEVLCRSSCRDAVFLVLARTLDQQCAELGRQAHAIRWIHTDPTAKAEAQAALDLLWREGLPARHSAIAKVIRMRVDAGEILGPWMRHIVRSVDLPPDEERSPLPMLARLALDASTAALNHSIELERSAKPDAACLVARMIAANGRDDQFEGHWKEWTDLILSEDDSLEGCGDVALSVVGDTLANLSDPLSAWRSLTSKLQPLLRRRARHGAWGQDDVVFPLVIAGINAAARLQNSGRLLLEHVFDTALRHFLVDQPPPNHRSFKLPAYVFAACPSVMLESADVEAMIGRLPMPAHVALAREQMARAVPESAAGVDPHHDTPEKALGI